jgi:hypothetical protein
MALTLDLVAGPDAGRRVVLDHGRHLVGRAPWCSLAIEDPAVEAHHLLLAVAEDGGIALLQLAGRVAALVDGEPAFAGAWRRAERSIEVGDSRLELAGTGDRLAGSLELGIRVDAVSERVTLATTEGTLVGIADSGPGLERARAVERSITSQVLRIGSMAAMPGLVLGVPDDRRLDACTALLEVGARWRGRWTPDISDPGAAVRLHVAGVRRSASVRIDRAFVAEQVPRSVAELGGDVVRVPQPA